VGGLRVTEEEEEGVESLEAAKEMGALEAVERERL